MLGSDPVFNGSISPSGEWEQFLSSFNDLKKIVWFPTGRLHEAPQYYRVVPTWASILPPADQLFLFDDIYLYREMLRKYAPSSILPTWMQEVQPQCAYTMAHWRSPQVGGLVPTDPDSDSDVGLWNMFWYLFYGDFSGLGALQQTDQLDQTGLNYELQSVDSGGSAATGEGEPPSFSGWTLTLIHKFFTIPDNSGNDQSGHADAAPVVNFHAVGAWSLDQDPALSPYTVWDHLSPTKWNMFINLLNFPANFLTLTPWQP